MEVRPDEDNDRILTALIVRACAETGLDVVKVRNSEPRAATLVLARAMRDIQKRNRGGP